MSAQPLSPAEAAVVARFDAAEPAPESWRGDDGLRSALAGPARDWQERHRQGSFATTPDQFVNALLALPEVAALRAKAAAADRVRELADEMGASKVRDRMSAQSWEAIGRREAARLVLAVLDGPPC